MASEWATPLLVANQDVSTGAWSNESNWNACKQGGLPGEREQEQRSDTRPEHDGEDRGNVQIVTDEMPQDSVGMP